ncbi:MAG TPA: hypothetical protein VMP01_14790 [Pirellulaceae bacterium]|nr:hypothetical protein [Pirellulaceae bacterium]
MNSRCLVETGAHVALAAASWLDSQRTVPRRALHEYWSASKCRLQRWLITIQKFSVQSLAGSPRESLAWEAIRPHIEEILASELLARTWAATAKAYDECRDEPEAAPVAVSTLAGHLEARNRVLHVLSFGQQFAVVEAGRLNDLRQKMERWCDMLLAHVALRTDVRELAFDAARCRDFADDLRDAHPQDDALSRELILASLTQSFRFALGDYAPNADLNEQVAASALTCVGQHPLDTAPPVTDSAWLARLHRKADETAGLIEELLS